MTPPAWPESTAALCLFFIFLVPFAVTGLALINAGLGRSRSAAHSMLTSLSMLAVAGLVYWACGFAWQGFSGRPAHVFTVSGKVWNWLAAEPFFFRGLEFDGSAASLAAWLQMLSVGLAALIPLGSGADRWRLSATCASTALLAGCTYPLFAHWAWGGGWLAQLGTNCGLGRGFLDAGGAGPIQVVGGLTALSITWILGARRGRFAVDGMPAAIPGHNVVLVLFGCLLAWIGWLGLNSAGSLLFFGASPGRVPLIAVNTTLAAASAALVAMALTRFRFTKPDASLTANSWVGGLAASSATGAFVPPIAAVFVGALSGVLVIAGVELLEVHLSVDDPGGAIPTHALCGLWGLLAAGIFTRFPGQFTAQLVGVMTLIGFVLPLTYGLNWLLNRVHPQRVSHDGERQGMDLHDLGAGAYPEFMTHGDDFAQR